MDYKEVFFTGHAIQRMFERGISKEDVMSVLTTGEKIAEYPEDRPFPSCLMSSSPGSRPLHVVVAFDLASRICHIITAYYPDPSRWTPDGRNRRQS
jgi:hypothetical protein